MTVINEKKKDRLISEGVNPKKAYHQSHTHLKSNRVDFEMGKIMIKNCIYQKKPQKKGHRELREHEYLEYIKSHIRISDEPFYKERLERFIVTRKNKSKGSYINIGIKQTMEVR